MSCRSTYGSHGTPLSVFEPEDETPERRGADAEGYLKVALRVRPLIDGRGGRTKLHVNSDRGEVVVEGETDERGRTNTSSKFRFSNTFEDEDNLTIFQTIGRPLVESVMVGFNGTLFAYGQTGSGKTYTIGDITKLGTMHEGVAHRMIRALYSLAEQESEASSTEYVVSVQYVQIYLERVYDLLAESPSARTADAPSLALREGKEGVFVEGATTHAAPTVEACLALLTRGSKSLKIAETQMNRTSSRSHSVCRLFVEGRQLHARFIHPREPPRPIAPSPIGRLRMPNRLPSQASSPMERRTTWLSQSGTRQPSLDAQVPTRTLDAKLAADDDDNNDDVNGDDELALELNESLPPAPPPSLSRELSCSPRTPGGRPSLRMSLASGLASGQSLVRRHSMASEVTPMELDGKKSVDLGAWRRHSIAMISELIEEAVTTNGSTKAALTLCDLAGSEDVGRSGATGVTLTEAKKINTSLLALGNVIHALTRSSRVDDVVRAGHVPFRDSVLTRLLQESIGGDCKTSLVVCVSPADADRVETLSTLRFGSRAKLVKNQAKAHTTIDVSDLSERLRLGQLTESLQQQLDESQQLLQAAQSNMEHRAAVALQFSVRLRAKQREVRAAMQTLVEERERVSRQAEQTVLEVKETMEKLLLEKHQEAALVRQRLETQLSSLERLRADEAVALRRKLAAVEAQLEAETAATGRALVKAEAQAKAVAEAKAAAEEEMNQLVQQHAAELREREAALEVEKEKCYAAIAAATSSHTAHAKALESLAAEVAAEASAREAKLNERLKEVSTALETMGKRYGARSEEVAKERARRELSESMLDASKKTAAAALLKKAAAHAAAQKAAEHKMATATEAAVQSARAQFEAEKQEAIKTAVAFREVAVAHAVHAAVSSLREELRAEFEEEKASAVVSAKAEAIQREAASAESRLAASREAAAAELKAAVTQVEQHAAASLSAALAEARQQSASALDNAVSECRAQFEALRWLAIEEATVEAQAEVQQAMEAQALLHSAALAAAHEEGKARLATAAEESAQLEERLREELAFQAAEHEAALDTAWSERVEALRSAAELAEAQWRSEVLLLKENAEATERELRRQLVNVEVSAEARVAEARSELEGVKEKAASAAAEHRADLEEAKGAMEAALAGMRSENEAAATQHELALASAAQELHLALTEAHEERRAELAMARREAEAARNADAEAHAVALSRFRAEKMAKQAESQVELAAAQRAAQQQESKWREALSKAQDATSRARADANTSLAALAALRKDLTRAHAEVEALKSQMERLRSEHAAELISAAEQSGADRRNEIAKLHASHSEALEQRAVLANERAAAASEREQALIVQIELLRAEQSESSHLMAALASAEAEAHTQAVRHQEASRVRAELDGRFSYLKHQVAQLQDRCERAEAERDQAEVMLEQSALERAEAQSEADALRTSLGHAVHISTAATYDAVQRDSCAEAALSSAAARVAALEAAVAEATAPKYAGRDIFRRTRVRLANSLANFEEMNLVESERLHAEDPTGLPKHPSHVGKWVYDPALGRAVRYGTTPVVDTGARRHGHAPSP